LQRWLNLSYGVIPVHQKEHLAPQFMFTAAIRMLRQKGYISLEDKIAYLSGSFGEGGGTTFVEINKVAMALNADSNYRFHLPEHPSKKQTGEPEAEETWGGEN